MPRLGSHSDAQQEAEGVVLGVLSTELGLHLGRKKLVLGSGVGVALDGYGESPGRLVLVEVSAQIGVPKPGQQKKVLSDMLKLALVKATLTEEQPGRRVQAMIAFLDEGPQRWLCGAGWCALAAKRFGIESRLVRVGEEVLAKVRSAKRRQNLLSEDE